MTTGLRARLEALVARVPRGMMLGLDRVARALAALGDPHLAVPAVHIAGSNGKGSTSAMIESVARSAGLRTGLTTSPHLCRFAERIRLDGAPIADDAFEACLAQVIERCEPELTFFESLTVAAFVAFADARVDLAVLEVGLGGRLDATNVIRAPIATAVTSISLEHTNFLGTTLAAIAREKAGIFKPGAPVVLGVLPSQADDAATEVAERVQAGPIVRVASRSDLASLERERPDPHVVAVHHDGVRAHLRGPGDADVLMVTLGLDGPHQARNAGVAAGVLEAVARRFPDHDVRGARRAGLEGVVWPGRLERFPAASGVTVLLDAAHNPEGIAALRAAVSAPPSRVALVFGALADKRWPEMLATLAPVASRRYYTQPRGREPAPLEGLAAVAEGVCIAAPHEALARALAESAPGDTVLVAGSIYLVGELRAGLLGIEADPVIAL
jgi:dihydrofolate synthase/folylpolyglutamate synthase